MGSKDTYYFSHDSNALSDPKILNMRCDYGFESYGLYWAIIEMLRNESNYKLPLSKNTYRAIKMQTGTSIDIEQFIKDCINEYKGESGNGLFNADGRNFWSESLLRRMKKYETIKEKRTAAANTRWSKNKEENANINAKINNAKQKQCKCIKGYCKSNANAYKNRYTCNAKLCKLNKIKLNKIKLNKNLSIYLSSSLQENENHKKVNEIDEMDKIDEIGQAEFNDILQQCQIGLYNDGLKEELTNVLKELYLDNKTRQKLRNANVQHIDKALRNFSIANSKEDIKKPKEYFKKCLLSVLQDFNISNQFDIDTINQNLDSGG